MKTYAKIPSDLPPTALAIGTFDGVHLGHRALLKRLREVSSHCTVLTFANHPLQILKPDTEPPLLLTPLPAKLALLEACGIDVAIALPFTRELAALSYADFLAQFPLTHLILGAGDAFGKNRDGHPANILRLAAKENFKVEYIDKVLVDGEPVSSRRIRATLASNDFENGARLLGRPIKGAYV